MRSQRLPQILVLSLALFSLRWPARPKAEPLADDYREWRMYGGSADNIHYSTLDQINRGNVRNLTVAWEYDSGDAFPGSQMECNPIIMNQVLFATSPRLRAMALDAASGKLLWSFDPNEHEGIRHLGARMESHNRGVTYWASGTDRRIFFVAGRSLWALNAATGKPIAGFGNSGRVDLRLGLGREPETVSITATSPGVVYGDLLILGSTLPEDLPAAPGDIRAFDVRTGKLRWIFHTIPHPGEFGYDTWPKDAWKHSGGANAWGGMTVDARRGLVFAPTGSAAFDFYGPDRIGDDLFANCLLALDAGTGKLAWYFQAVKHDLWDRDLPAAPALVTIERNGRPVDAVAQITKSGVVFVFERETGQPLFPIEYRPVPASDVDGERTARTQPFPLLPQPFAPQTFTEDMVTTRSPEAHRAVLERLRKLRYGGQFIPPSFQGTLVFPGLDGGGEWGGAAFDPTTRLLYVNSDSMVSIIRLVERPTAQGLVTGRALYLQNCASCHGADLSGGPRIPSLVGIGSRLTDSEIATVIRKGTEMMPPFARLGNSAVRAITAYLAFGKRMQVQAPARPKDVPWLKYMRGTPIRFFDPDGYPPMKPPWGTLNAISLDTGQIVWKVPLGEFPELVQKGLRNTGSDNYGGPLVTAGGLLFIGATDHDSKFRAYDKATGELLWEAKLPAGGNATPATYQVNGRQFVVIAAGGGKAHFGTAPSAATYVAFALPQ